MKEKLTEKQKLESYINNSQNPQSTKNRFLKEKLQLIKFMMRKGASQEMLDQLSKDYFKLRNIPIS